jgi:arginine decarboxylase
MPSSAVYAQIPVLCASGTGATPLAAFHAALVAVGLGRYNLVRLSSVVPPNTAVDGSGKADSPSGEWGDRLYCVVAEQRADLVGEEAWAGIGWVQRVDGQGGLFVEHEGTSEEFVTNAIRSSLHDMVAGMRDEFTGPDWVVNGTVCTGEPSCSLVIAPYECEPWIGVQ